MELKHIESSTHYKITRERKAIEAIRQDLDSRNFYDPVNENVHSHFHAHYIRSDFPVTIPFDIQRNNWKL